MGTLRYCECGALLPALYQRKWTKCRRCGSIVWNRRRLFAANTAVDTRKTMAEVMRIFEDFSPIVGQAGFAQDPDTATKGVEFVVRLAGEQTGWLARLMVSYKNEREERQAWRLLRDWVKMTLTSVAMGALKREEAFGGFAVPPELQGQSVGASLVQALEQRGTGPAKVGLFGAQVYVEIRALPALGEERPE